MRRLTGVAVSVLLVAAAAPPAQSAAGHGARPFAEVTAVAETPAVEEDNADDPAIWVDHRDPARSLVVGALKDFGLGVYDLSGRELQRIAPQPTPEGAAAPSRFNNVDIVRGFRLAGRSVDLAIVSDRGLDRVRDLPDRRLRPAG